MKETLTIPAIEYRKKSNWIVDLRFRNIPIISESGWVLRAAWLLVGRHNNGVLNRKVFVYAYIVILVCQEMKEVQINPRRETTKKASGW